MAGLNQRLRSVEANRFGIAGVPDGSAAPLGESAINGKVTTVIQAMLKESCYFLLLINTIVIGSGYNEFDTVRGSVSLTIGPIKQNLTLQPGPFNNVPVSWSLLINGSEAPPFSEVTAIVTNSIYLGDMPATSRPSIEIYSPACFVVPL